jgi:hypothetical protein
MLELQAVSSGYQRNCFCHVVYWNKLLLFVEIATSLHTLYTARCTLRTSHGTPQHAHTLCLSSTRSFDQESCLMDTMINHACMSKTRSRHARLNDIVARSHLLDIYTCAYQQERERRQAKRIRKETKDEVRYDF